MTERAPRILFLAHNPEIPSFRLRLNPVAERLAQKGAEVRIRTVRRGREVLRFLPLMADLRWADLVVVSKFKLFGPERSLVRRLSGPWIYDVDDAVMYGKPKFHGDEPDMARWRIRRFEAMCRGAALVSAATRILAERIPPGVRVEVNPTPVDCAQYPVRAHGAVEKPAFAWIGLGENLRYLNDLIPVLEEAALRIPGLTLHVISDKLPGGRTTLPIVLEAWAESSHGSFLAQADAGLAPLPEDAWTTGKGGYKIIQYMAAGLPVVASRLDAQMEIGGPENETVFYCESREEWITALERLAKDTQLRSRMGAAARRRAEEVFDVNVVSERYAALILETARQRMNHRPTKTENL